jgi:hypothetical protein
VDLKTLKMTDSTTIEIMHPETDKPMGITITLAHRESAKVKAVANAAANKRLATMAKRGKREAPTAEGIESDGMELLVAATIRWTGIEEGDQPILPTPENVERIYIEYPWIRAQVDEAFGDVARFFQK